MLVADRTFFACRGVREAYDGFAEEFGEEFVNDASVTANKTVGTFKTHDLLLLAIVVVVGEIVERFERVCLVVGVLLPLVIFWRIVDNAL